MTRPRPTNDLIDRAKRVRTARLAVFASGTIGAILAGILALLLPGVSGPLALLAFLFIFAALVPLGNIVNVPASFSEVETLKVRLAQLHTALSQDGRKARRRLKQVERLLAPPRGGR